MFTILEILNLSTQFLQQKGIQHPRRQAEELIGEALKIGRMGLYLEFDRPLIDIELEKCRAWLKRRAQGEPLQYISGSIEFFDCEILVNPSVLIPRQETEILVDKISKVLAVNDLDGKVFWDVCCGSGCIGIALKNRFPMLTVCLSDISTEAIAQAKINAEYNEVDVQFFQGDLLAPFKGLKCDYFVCNPPYISESELDALDIEVRTYEPKQALIAGKTGLEFYSRLANDLPEFLNPGCKLWMEIGKGQGEGVKTLFHETKWKHSKIECDWSGHERFFSLEIE